MNSTLPPFKPAPLVHLTVDARAFGTDWAHCDQVANYLAQIISHDRADSFLYSNLLSTVLNELLEVIFSRHRPTGVIDCTLLRAGARDRIVLGIPVDSASRGYYERSVAATREPELAGHYTRSLLAEEPLDEALGFLELASDYRATLGISANEAGTHITLTVDVTLDQGEPLLTTQNC